MPARIPNPPLLPKHVRIQLPAYLPRQSDLEVPRRRGVPFPLRPGVGQGWRDVMPGDDGGGLFFGRGCVGEPSRVRLVKDVVDVEFREPGEAEGGEDPGREEERGGESSDEGGVGGGGGGGWGGGGWGCGGGGGGWAGGGGEDPVVEEGVDFAVEGGWGVDGCSWECQCWWMKVR